MPGGKAPTLARKKALGSSHLIEIVFLIGSISTMVGKLVGVDIAKVQDFNLSHISRSDDKIWRGWC